jgi:hypothetical protein
MYEIFFIMIGINIGMIIGWVLSKKFEGNIEELMKWLEAT